VVSQLCCSVPTCPFYSLSGRPFLTTLCNRKLDFEEERNQTVSFVMSSYVQLPPPLPSEKIARNIFDQTLTYGDAYAAHSALPYMDDACLCTLFRLLR
jgi:hypothetical protein